jgi:hypothetical protein
MLPAVRRLESIGYGHEAGIAAKKQAGAGQKKNDQTDLARDEKISAPILRGDNAPRAASFQ